MQVIWRLIKSDHLRHRELLARIADTSGARDARKTARDAFHQNVKAHEAAEEETFYSKLIEKTRKDSMEG